MLVNKSHLLQKVIVSMVLGASMAAGYTAYAHLGYSPVSEAHAIANETTAAEPVRKSAITLPDFAEIAAQQGNAVVNISVSAKINTRFSRIPQLDPDDPFYEFFRRFQPPVPRGTVPQQELGSGFIVSPDGTILTNAHVVADADEVIVKLTDKREFKAKVAGLDKLSDVAVLKIEAKNLPVVKIGDPQRARVGEWVVAIGSPFGFENTVTAGIISAKSRSLPDEGYVPFLQTDVAVNPGNSGGPLFNANGEVIGINSQIYSRSGGYQGLSFAIPIDVAMKVERQLLEHGKVSRGRLGVVIQEVNQQLADTFGMDKPTGALVSSVEKGSPAEKAGIEPGDVILKFNGKTVDRSADLPPMVSEQTPGSAAKVELWHKGKSREISMNIGEMKSASFKGKSGADDNARLGLAVRPLTPEERKKADVADGLLVEGVDEGPAARAGIRPGDVILAVNGERISNVDQLAALIAKRNKRIALLIQRGENTMFVPLNLG
jgi:serine protease Do